MFRKIAFASVVSLGLLLPGAAQAQWFPGPWPYPHHHRHSYQVQYLSSVWQERTFSNHYDARQFERLQQSLGHDAYLERHGFHWHVRYRTSIWQTYTTVSSHYRAHELERYLESLGYRARVVHI